MVIPFSNTKLRVPKGFQSLLVGLSTEILRSQPRNIYEFSADYFEKLLQRRDQGESYLPDQQTSLEDRYYNNQTFQEEYSVNDPEVNNAATKIQAKFRGHKARQNVDKIRQENKDMIDTDQQDLGYGREQTGTPKEDENRAFHDGNQKSPRLSSAPSDKQHNPTYAEQLEKKYPFEEELKDVVQPFEAELTEEEKVEQDRAARSIQARFRGQKVRQSGNQGQASPGSASERDQLSDRPQHHESDNDKPSSRSSTRLSGKIDTDLHGSFRDHDQIETGDKHDTDRSHLQREPTQLSEDFERHPPPSHFDLEQQADFNYEEADMNDPNQDKAATRIQASFRGYKTRKELGTGGTSDQQPSTSSHTHDEYDNGHNKILSSSAEGNKEPEGEEDDNTAAVKIQAAYRGYRARKDLEK